MVRVKKRNTSLLIYYVRNIEVNTITQQRIDCVPIQYL